MTDPTARRPARRLNAKQRAFAQEYLVDLNATQAAIRAGYKESAANRAGWRLLRLPGVAEAIAASMAARAERTRVSADRVLLEYARLAFADMRTFAEWGPQGMKLRPHTALSDADAAAVKELTEIGPEGRPKLRLHDKHPALAALARHLGLFGTGPGGFVRYSPGTPIDIPDAVRDRARANLKIQIDRVMKEREEKNEEEGE
ncbi:MAG: terminase small subunit [Stellaceae bacterium]